MCWQPRSAERRFGQAGFTLLELMVGLVVGLLATLAVTHVLVAFEAQKRTIAAGSEAQVNGALALGTLQQSLLSAGYGFSSFRPVLGCELRARFKGQPPAGFPDRLVPVTITDGGPSGAPDSVRVLASGKDPYALPLRIAAPYSPGHTAFQVATVLGTAADDFMAAAPAAAGSCELFRITSTPGGAALPRANAAEAWNPEGFPANAYGVGDVLVNLGPQPVDITYSVGAGSLRARTLRIAADGAASYDGPVGLFADVVNLQALYGKDTEGDGVVDAWDADTPVSNAGWLQVLAVRVAVAVRSAQPEAETVTHANPEWDVGTAGTVAGASTCAASRCLRMRVDNLPDWQRFRYRVFETTVPLRNMLWSFAP